METRVVNKYKENYDVYIGRGSLFGNPYSSKPNTKAHTIVDTREESIVCYRNYFYERLEIDEEFKAAVLSLKGKTLGCFCKPLPCHGDVIAEFLNNI